MRVLLGLLFLVSTCSAQIDWGFDFRATSGYVTDVSPDTYVASDTYPVTRNSEGPFGWTSGVGTVISTRDRTTGQGAKLAGMQFTTNYSSSVLFRINVGAAGTYKLSFAVGDPSSGINAFMQVFDSDTTTSLLSLGPTAASANNFMAADGVIYTAANWLTTGSTKTVNVTITGTSLYFRMWQTGGGGGNGISYFRVQTYNPNAHSYWRIIGTGTYTGTRAGVNGVVFYDAGASVIPFSGGTGTVDSSDIGSATAVFDGSAATDWVSSAGASHWVQYQFASSVEVASFDIIATTATWITYGFVDFTLDYSDNGSAWTTKYTYKQNGANALVVHHFTSTNVYVASPTIYYRLSVNSNVGQGTSAGYLEIADLKYYNGSAVQIPTTTYSAAASSQLNEAETQVSQLFDSDSSSIYISLSAGWPKTIDYRWGSSVTVASFSLTNGNEGGGLCTSRAPVTFDLYSSVNGSTWVLLGSYTAASWTACTQTQTFTVATSRTIMLPVQGDE